MSTIENLSKKSFRRQLGFGQAAETEIAQWLIRRGYYVFPAYDIEYDTGKGPRIFGPGEQVIVPDLFALKGHRAIWIEAKHKNVFTWYRNGKPEPRWTTGIDLHHYKNYLRVAKLNDEWPVWLFFLHRSPCPHPRDLAEGCPEICPVGLFGERLNTLRSKESHRSRRWGRTGMVYWAHESLKLLAPLSEVCSG